MEMIPVASSNVYSIGYSNNVLYVRLLSGALYEYYNVNVDIYYAFLNASSKGKFVRYVLNKYPYKPIH